jgi:hypothetical protein
MRRRDLLRSGAVAGIALVGGCLGGDVATASDTRSFPATSTETDGAPLTAVDVYSQQGDVTVRPTDASEVTVDVEKRTRAGEDALSASSLEADREGETLVLKGLRESRNPISDGPQVSMDLDISLPTLGETTVELHRVETRLGDVTVGGVSGYPELVTDLGDISVQGVTGFSRVAGDGDVGLTIRELDSPENPVTVDSGDLTLRLDQALDCTFDLRVEFGEISNYGVPLQNLERTDESLTGQLGTGANQLTGTVESGDVALYPLDAE